MGVYVYVFRWLQWQINRISTLVTGETVLRTWLIISMAFESSRGDRVKGFRLWVSAYMFIYEFCLLWWKINRISTLVIEETVLKTWLIISMAFENSHGDKVKDLYMNFVCYGGRLTGFLYQ